MAPVASPKVLHLPLAAERSETPSVLTVLFDLGEHGFDYRPGQYVLLELAGVEDPRGPNRPFTLASSPTEPGRLQITTRRTGSPFKDRLAALDTGAEAEIRGPLGTFVLVPDRPAVLLTGGIGITPFRSMIRYAVDSGLATPIVLIYANRTPEEIVFRAELDGLAAAHDPLTVIHTITRPEEAAEAWSGHTGRIGVDLVRPAIAGLDDPLFYACGPPGMVRAMSELVHQELGAAADDLRSEEFEGY